MRVLVTGGAGFIGSHTVVRLAEAGHEPLIVDNFANSDPAVLDRLATLVGTRIAHREFDLRDERRLDALLATEPVTAVIHFAGLKSVAESVRAPLEYYDTNVRATLTLLGAMRRHGIDTLVFSSSAAVYGQDATAPIPETAAAAPVNPYGRTKAMIEQILRDVAAAGRPSRVALLRYFNPVGAHPSGLIGEDPRGVPNNLVPFIAQVAHGRRDRLRVFGDDYPTPDGTCLRDYIHIEDLAAGHLAALDALAAREPGVHTWNLGTGRPTSVLEMIAAFGAASGREISYEVTGRRPGDVAVSYADPSRARAELGWTACRGVDEMCADAWRWQSRNPRAYAS